MPGTIQYRDLCCFMLIRSLFINSLEAIFLILSLLFPLKKKKEKKKEKRKTPATLFSYSLVPTYAFF